MPRINSLPLDYDIIDSVLAALPDYATLLAALLSSKYFYKVYKAHPKSIIRAISYNITGPALPQAIRLLRCKAPTKSEDTDRTTAHRILQMESWSEDSDIGLITGEECCQLVKDAATVKGLEDLFSLMHKDRTSNSSVLDYMESLRFRRAIYRLMLFAKIFHADDYENEDEDIDPAVPEHDRLARKKLLDDFATSELFELHSASLFLIEIAQGINTGENHIPSQMDEDVTLARGPEMVLQAYRLPTTDHLLAGNLSTADIVDGTIINEPRPQSLVGYLSDPLQRIWEERQSKPLDNSSHWRSSLDDIRGSNDTCEQCGTICGLDLWNESTWDHLWRFSFKLGRYGIPKLLKGYLHDNIVDGKDLAAQLRCAYLPPRTNLLEQMHQVKTPSWATWKYGDWLCKECIIDILVYHLHLWLLEVNRERGEEIKEDCWYGYNCRTQRHSVHHAGRLNHLCEPTR